MANINNNQSGQHQGQGKGKGGNDPFEAAKVAGQGSPVVVPAPVVVPPTTVVIPEAYLDNPMIKMCLSMTDPVQRDNGLTAAIAMLDGMAESVALIKAKDEKLAAKEAELAIKNSIIERPNRLTALIPAVEASKVIPEELTKIIVGLGLTLQDVEGYSVVATFPAGVVKVTAQPTVVKQVKASGGTRSGGEVKSHSIIDLDKVQYVSAHEMAMAFQIKYNGMESGIAALQEAQTYDSQVYVRADGTPVLVKDGKLTKEADYIKTEKMAKELGIDLTGCTKTNKRYHPFKFKLEPAGQVIKGGDTTQKYTATKVAQAINPDRSLVVVV